MNSPDVQFLQEYASSFPEMGGATIGPWLRKWAATCDTNIVEVGCWLGAGTAHLALGALESGAAIRTHDRWVASVAEVRKAKAFGVDLEIGQDTLPWVRKRLEPFSAEIEFVKADLMEAEWDGRPIGLYVDDAAKAPDVFSSVVSTFGPSWEDGCIVVLMDFHYYPTYHENPDQFRFQQEFVAARPRQFTQVADRLAGRINSVFRYRSRRRWWREPPLTGG